MIAFPLTPLLTDKAQILYTTHTSIPEHDLAFPIVRRVLEEEIRPPKSHVKVTGGG